MNKAFWLSILGDCWEKSICCSLPARLMEEFPCSQQGVPTTHNLQPGILGGFTGCGRSKVQFTRSVEGAERSDARNGGSTKIAEKSRNWALTKISFHLLKMWFKFLSLDKFIPFPFLSNVSRPMELTFPSKKLWKKGWKRDYFFDLPLILGNFPMKLLRNI